MEAAAAALGPALAEARARGVPLVISYESLGGRPFGQMSQREVTAHRIKAVFPQARILVSVREQTAILNSMYGEYLRFGHTSRLADFINQDTGSPNIQPHLEIEYYDYFDSLALYEAIFGEGRVMVAPMEWFTAHPEAFAEALAGLLQVPLGLDGARIERRPERPALSPPARALQRFLNQFHPADTRNRTGRGLRLAPNTIAQKLDRMVPAGMRKSGLEAQKKLIADMVGRRFAESNRALAERTGFDLAGMGYVVG
jgi:hypothetical protein